MKRESKSLIFTSFSEEETIDFARNLAKTWRGKEIAFLYGELGSGKTVFARGLAAGLGVKDIREVCSPSFTLINIYYGRCPIFHVDLYRLEHQEEILDLGWEDWLGQGVIIVEWAEKINFDLGHPIYHVVIKIGDQGEREISLILKNSENLFSG
ncbi:MAG: tRNA (adenosine(37)-N6)-threonylcarbamoyltransferase complex ATPase subunit type 1 TsaE [Candidatus Aminicenantes bacterium]|nr:tRNA (adenosine(37)-N6)-threonylcarbamoyltransferase complex ATPase subunit type 1 TsaE [Candidatus Aminicenantes bacterium]